MTNVTHPWTVALLEVSEELTAIGRDDDLDGEDWLLAVMRAFMQTPLLFDLDPMVYDALLTWAGFDLDSVDGLHTAAKLTAVLTAAGFVSLDQRCPVSPVAELAASDVMAGQRAWAEEFAGSDEAEAHRIFALGRMTKMMQAFIDGLGPGAEPEAA